MLQTRERTPDEDARAGPGDSAGWGRLDSRGSGVLGLVPEVPTAQYPCSYALEACGAGAWGAGETARARSRKTTVAPMVTQTAALPRSVLVGSHRPEDRRGRMPALGWGASLRWAHSPQSSSSGVTVATERPCTRRGCSQVAAACACPDWA